MERAMARVTDALAVLAERSALGAERSARLNERSSESECKLDAPIHRNLEFEHWMKLLAERSAESRRKLNALIDLMGRCPR